MKRIPAFIVSLLMLAVAARPQVNLQKTAVPKAGDTANLKESVQYVLHIDTTDLSGYDIEMFIHNAPPNFQLAMAKHHEYDDRFWRYVQHFRVETDSGLAGNFVRKDSALWQISVPGKNAVIRYRIHL